MADIADGTQCATCTHLASGHEDVSAGKNSGKCTMANCDCTAMSVAAADDAEAEPPAGDAPAEGAPADNSTDPATLAQQIDDILDGILSSVSDDDLADKPAQQFYYLVQAADSSADLLCAALGVADPDEGISGTPTDDPADLAQALDASVDAAITAGKAVSAPVDAVAQAISDLDAADPLCDSLLTALDEADPDDEDEPTAEPAPAPAKATAPARASARKAAMADDPAAPADDAAPADTSDVPFDMPIMVLEGVDTGDGRYIQPNTLTWRELPLPVMALTKTTWGHDEAELVARIDTIDRFDASTLINPKTGAAYGTVTYTDYTSENEDMASSPVMALKASGYFATLEYAETVAQLIRDQFLRGVSVDIGDVKSVLEFLDDNGDPIGDVDEEDLWDIMFIDFDDVREVLFEGRVMGSTVCPFPAFEGAYIEVPDGASTVSTPALVASAAPGVETPRKPAINIISNFGERDCGPCENGAPIVASAGPIAPPKSWFEDPEFSEATPLTITEDGRVFGHLAVWGTCHTNSGGYGSRCVKPPHSASNYSYFRTGALKTAEGTLVAVGQITLDTNHAPLTANRFAATEHYDNTGTAVADIACGEDRVGIWVAGAVRPDITPAQVRKLRAAALSGDWRQAGSSLEMLAALAVNVPGFPVPRAMTAGGALTALTAAGGRGVIDQARQSMADMRDLLSMKGEIVELVNEGRAARLRRRVHGSE